MQTTYDEIRHKIIVCNCGKFGFYKFRFGPLIFIKIKISYNPHFSIFTTEIIEGPQLKNFETLFAKEINDAKSEIIKAVNFLIRRHNIEREKKRADMVEKESLTRQHLRMIQKNSKTPKPHDIVPETNDEEENYFGDKTKIYGRKTID
jgi:hypothetical protein